MDWRVPLRGMVVERSRGAAEELDEAVNLGGRAPRHSWVSRLSCINLTTVGQDADRMAALAVDRAIARLNGQAAEREIVLPPYLVVRGTTAAPSPQAVPLRRARAR